MHLMMTTRAGTLCSIEYHITMYMSCDRQHIITFFNYVLHNVMYKAKFMCVCICINW